jgi:hypothetical protein
MKKNKMKQGRRRKGKRKKKKQGRRSKEKEKKKVCNFFFNARFAFPSFSLSPSTA